MPVTSITARHCGTDPSSERLVRNQGHTQYNILLLYESLKRMFRCVPLTNNKQVNKILIQFHTDRTHLFLLCSLGLVLIEGLFLLVEVSQCPVAAVVDDQLHCALPRGCGWDVLKKSSNKKIKNVITIKTISNHMCVMPVSSEALERKLMNESNLNLPASSS